MPDIGVANYGSIFLFTALSERGNEFLREHTASEEWQWIGGESLAVEHRYAPILARFAQDEGLVVA